MHCVKIHCGLELYAKMTGVLINCEELTSQEMFTIYIQLTLQKLVRENQ